MLQPHSDISDLLPSGSGKLSVTTNCHDAFQHLGWSSVASSGPAQGCLDSNVWSRGPWSQDSQPEDGWSSLSRLGKLPDHDQITTTPLFAAPAEASGTLNPLCKVLCILQSLYLCTIGSMSVFCLAEDTPCTSNCSPKQLYSWMPAAKPSQATAHSTIQDSILLQ